MQPTKEERPEHSVHLSDYRIDRHLLGMDSEQDEQLFLAHIGACSSCREKVAELRAQQQSYELPSALVARVVDAAGPSGFWEGLVLPWYGWVGALSAVGALAFLWTLPTFSLFSDPNPLKRKTPHVRRDTPNGFLVKGKEKPLLWVALQRGKVIRYARSGERFYPKDRIRLAFQWKAGTSLKKRYVYLLHQDCQSLSPLYPRTKSSKSQAILSDERVKVPGSFELEENPKGSEMIWACFSHVALTYQHIAKALPACQQWQKGKVSVKQQACDTLVAFTLKQGQ